jgi:CubicO group peptidase (beta-lactamase class C family)
MKALQAAGALLVLLAVLCSVPARAEESAPSPTGAVAAAVPEIDRMFAEFALDARVPGLVWGVVVDGRLVHVNVYGVQDIDARRPVTPDSVFRIASMTKAFTALAVLGLRDAGRLSLEAHAEIYVPELRGWAYPTSDSPRIRVRDLLHHTAGFVTDDPWGDRQQPLPEAAFTAMLRHGPSFNQPPGMAYEYSNLGYAILGRIIANVSGEPYADHIARTLLQPLGMNASRFEVADVPDAVRSRGYRWEDGRWRLEPTMAHGAFGAMGGMHTTARDYARWVAWLLSAWPPRDDAQSGPVRRATVREIGQGSNFASVRPRFGSTASEGCRHAAAYGMGFVAAVDCELGLTLSHGGGYPGFGSHLLLLPDHGIGVFAFANRTYAGPAAPVWDAALALRRAGALTRRSMAVSPELAAAYRAAGQAYRAGDLAVARDMLAGNVFLDRDREQWRAELARVRGEAGACDTAAPVEPTGERAGHFTWRCATARVRGELLLAPTPEPAIQLLTLTATAP